MPLGNFLQDHNQSPSIIRSSSYSMKNKMHAVAILFVSSHLAGSLVRLTAAFVPGPLSPVEATPAFHQAQTSHTVLRARKKWAVDAVRYKPFDPQGSCDNAYDSIVIGSGIGGLATASLLAQSEERHKVLVLEQHSVCGGCCHTFQRKGYTFPTGIHYIGQMDDGSGLKGILDSLTPQDNPIMWDRMDNNYDDVVLGSGADLRRYHIIGGPGNVQAENLKKQFPPDTHDAIDKYYRLIQEAHDSNERAMALKCLPLSLTRILRITGLHRVFDRGYRKYASKSLAEVVKSLTDNEDLRAVMCYNWDNYGSRPSLTPFLMHSVIVPHFKGGAFFPRDGPDQIPNKIIPSITAAGGAVLSNAPVKRIVVDADTGRASGVEMMDGRVIRAKKAVVSDAGVVNTIGRLLSTTADKREKLLKSFFSPRRDQHERDHIHNGASGLTLFVGLKGDHDADFQLPPSQQWVYPNASVENYLKDLQGFSSMEEAAKNLSPKDIGLVFIASSSTKDSEWKHNHPGRTTLEIMTSAPWEWFEALAPGSGGPDGDKSLGTMDPGGKPGSHGQTYKEAKRAMSDLIWSRVVEVLSSSGAVNLPKTLDAVDHHELGTPLTYAHFYRREKGAFYGLDHNMNRFEPRVMFERLRPEVEEIPGLFLTGQDVSTCGFGGALVGGVMCASKVLNRPNPFSIVGDIHAARAEKKEARDSEYQFGSMGSSTV